jgi:hypothetical protein
LQPGLVEKLNKKAAKLRLSENGLGQTLVHSMKYSLLGTLVFKGELENTFPSVSQKGRNY